MGCTRRASTVIQPVGLVIRRAGLLDLGSRCFRPQVIPVLESLSQGTIGHAEG